VAVGSKRATGSAKTSTALHMSAWPLPRTAGRTAGHRLCKSFRRVKLLHTQMHMQRTGNHGLFAAGFALTDMRPRSRDSKTGVASAPAAWNCTQSTVSSAAAVTSPRVSVRALRLRATPLEHMNSTHTHSTHTHSTKTHSTHSRPRTPCGAPDATLCFFLPSLSRSPSPLTSSTSPLTSSTLSQPDGVSRTSLCSRT